MEKLQKQFIYPGLALFISLISSTSNDASIGDLFITEIMANPAAVSDTAGEWFELYNPTSEVVELTGVVLSDDGSNSHTISTENLIIFPDEYFVMARNGDPGSNGGFIADYIYSGFSLGNSSDQIILTDSLSELRLDYTSGFVAAGQSSELISNTMIETGYALTDSSLTYGLGDIGTPGAAGSFTPAPVPVPAAVWLFSSGLAGLIGISRRKKSKS